MVEYRKLTLEDLGTFIDMRINQLQEEGAKATVNLKPALEDYYKRHIQDEHLSRGLRQTATKSLPQAVCHLWRNLLITVVRQGK